MNDLPARPTLKTIAQITGLAVPTVSRALSDAPDIGAGTRARVRDVADQIGYIPNRAGLRLRTGRTQVIALVLPSNIDMTMHTTRMISAVATALRKTPYHLNVTPYFPEDDLLAPVKRVVEQGMADAVIFNQTMPQDPRVTYLMKRGFPFATHGRTDWADQHAYFDFDNGDFARAGVTALAGRGRRNLRLLAPRLQQTYARDMAVAFEQATRDAGVRGHVIDGISSDHPIDEIEPQVTALLQAEPAIDGILCGSAGACLGAVSGAEAAGRSIAQDIDLYAKEASPLLKRFRPGLMVMHEDSWNAGTFLAEAAIARIENPDAPPMQHLDHPQIALD